VTFVTETCGLPGKLEPNLPGRFRQERGSGATGLENVKMAQWTGFKSISESMKIDPATVTTAKPESAMGWSLKAGARTRLSQEA
jgi:hypothetical protein